MTVIIDTNGITTPTANITNTTTVNTMVDATGNTILASSLVQGSAKAWVSFNGTNGTLNSSFNVSSVTVVSTGVYTINLTSAMPNTKYCVQISNQQNSTTNYSSNIANTTTTTSVTAAHFESGSLAFPATNTAIFVTVFSS